MRINTNLPEVTVFVSLVKTICWMNLFCKILIPDYTNGQQRLFGEYAEGNSNHFIAGLMETSVHSWCGLCQIICWFHFANGLILILILIIGYTNQQRRSLLRLTRGKGNAIGELKSIGSNRGEICFHHFCSFWMNGIMWLCFDSMCICLREH